MLDRLGGLVLDLFDLRLGSFDGFAFRFFFALDLLDLNSLCFMLLLVILLLVVVLMFVLMMLVVPSVFSLLVLVLLALVSLSLLFLFPGVVLPGLLLEGFGDIADSCPIFSVLSLLPSHLDEEAPVADFFIEAVPDEVDGVDSGLEDDFEGARVVFFYFDELEVGECFFNILLDGIEVAFHQVEGDVLDLVVHQLDLVDQLLLLGEHESVLLLFLALHQQHNLINIKP